MHTRRFHKMILIIYSLLFVMSFSSVEGLRHNNQTSTYITGPTYKRLSILEKNVGHNDTLHGIHEPVLDDCGGYFKLGAFNDTKYIYSPNYPKPYDTASLCIWRVDASHVKEVELAIQGFVGAVFAGKCSHVLEIRALNKAGPTLSRICGPNSPDKSLVKYNIKTTSHHIWIKFRTDNINNGNHHWRIAFYQDPKKIIDNLHYEKWKNHYDAQITCKGHQFECRNRECISMSYRCDGINDCGCIENCDEVKCYENLSILQKNTDSKSSKKLGIFIGCAVFFGICLFVELLNAKERLVNESLSLAPVGVPKKDTAHTSKRKSTAITATLEIEETELTDNTRSVSKSVSDSDAGASTDLNSKRSPISKASAPLLTKI